MTQYQTIPSQFAPVNRASDETVQKQSRYFLETPLLRRLFDAIPDAVLILNKERQIIFANRALLEMLDISPDKDVRGLRPGEALDCVRAFETEGGCGTTEFCSTCGAVKAILASLEDEKSIEECRITQRSGRALDLRVWATPLEFENESFSVIAIKDISDEKRRRVLEHIFFHDLLNAVGSLRGYATLLQDAGANELETIKRSVYNLSERLIEEINSQKEIIAAENDELVPHPVPLNALELLEEVAQLYRRHDVAKDRHVKLIEETQNLWFISDRVLLRRAIGNLVKNALEACWPGEIVTLTCVADNGEVEFRVHNPNYMARQIQLQIFQRSFSTKGIGRGLGTYSAKLLTERYLKGRITFNSSPAGGTTFIARYPLKLIAEQQ